MGCAGPFLEAKPSSGGSSVALAFCGSKGHRPGGVVGAMDGPPVGETSRTTNGLAAPHDTTICVQVTNRGTQPLRVDRSRFHLKCPREVQPWTPDRDEDRFMIPPGATRKVEVGFSYSPLAPGEQVSVVFDDALSADAQPVHVPPLVLRHR